MIYISQWEVRKSWRGEGLGVALLHQALERLPADVYGRPNGLCVAPEPYQTEMKHFESLPAVLREELKAPASLQLAGALGVAHRHALFRADGQTRDARIGGRKRAADRSHHGKQGLSMTLVVIDMQAKLMPHIDSGARKITPSPSRARSMKALR